MEYSSLNRDCVMDSMMAQSPAPIFEPVYALKNHAEQLQHLPLGDVLTGPEGPARAQALQHTFGSLHVDISKQRITPETLALLEQWATRRHLPEKRRALFHGEQVNVSEERAALHMAARWPAECQPPAGMAPAVSQCHAQQLKLAGLVDKLHGAKWQGVTGQPLTEVVHIGVGGSDLGPRLVNNALADIPDDKGIRVHYVSTMDGSQLIPLMEELDPAVTLLVLASKSFTTADTRFNVDTALAWLSHSLGVSAAAVCRQQLLGVSACPDKMDDLGIAKKHQLTFPESIGGRFSVWSAIGVSIAVALGMQAFEQLQAGAHAMDRHFLDAPFARNLPMLLGSIGAWNTQFLGIPSHVVLPYDGRLQYLTPYLQQVEMESNGKSADMQGKSVLHATSPIIWGDVGSNAQHAFYQLLHQGSHTISADFLAVAQRNAKRTEQVAEPLQNQHAFTLANCLAQSRLMAFGDAAIPAGLKGEAAMGYRGNQPSTTIVLKTLDAWSLGALMAMYEHKVFVQAALWGLNPFDQPGVELGKQLATGLYQAFDSQESGCASPCDPTTDRLLKQVLEWHHAKAG